MSFMGLSAGIGAAAGLCFIGFLPLQQPLLGLAGWAGFAVPLDMPDMPDIPDIPDIPDMPDIPGPGDIPC